MDTQRQTLKLNHADDVDTLSFDHAYGILYSWKLTCTCRVNKPPLENAILSKLNDVML